MKKLFLTSGIIACMACPAFADPTPTFGGAKGPVANNAYCDNTNLGTYDTSATLQAIWVGDHGAMLLDDNIGSNTTLVGGSVASDYELFLTPFTDNANGGTGTAVYKRSGEGTTASPYVFTKQVANNTVVDDIPVGNQVGYTFTTTLPAPSASGLSAFGTPSTPTTTTPNRPFRGYFASTATNDALDSTRYIDNQGKLTGYGLDEQTGLVAYDNNAKWKALYGPVSPEVGNPSVYGYTFDGWKVGGTGTTYANTQEDPLPGGIYVETNLVAQWTAHQYTVTYNCNNAGAPNHQSATTLADQTITYAEPFQWRGNNDKSTNSGDKCDYSGKHFTGWTCTTTGADGSTITFSNTASRDLNEPTDNPASWTGASVTQWTQSNMSNNATIACVANWDNNTIGLTWTDPTGAFEEDTGSCEYSGSVTIPATPSRTGYTFGGWAVQQ